MVGPVGTSEKHVCAVETSNSPGGAFPNVQKRVDILVEPALLWSRCCRTWGTRRLQSD